jgi:energy-coupling factor transporter ATP-binding protein EcfA2
VKCGVSVDLGQKTVIVGPNGSGKSAIVNAVELALTGRASDIAGRGEVGRELDLMALAPRKEGRLFAAVKFSDGTTAEYATEGSSEKAKRATRKSSVTLPENILPLRDVTEAIRGSAETARKFFLQRVSTSYTDDEILDMFPGELRNMFTIASSGVSMLASPVDKLITAREYAGKAGREAKARVKAGREAANAVAASLPPPPSAMEIDDAEQKVRDAKAALKLAIRVEQQSEAVKNLTASEEHLATLKDAFEQAKTALDALPQPPALTEVQRTAIASLNAIHKAELDNCFTCGTVGVGKEKFASRAAAIAQMLATSAAQGKAWNDAKAVYDRTASAVQMKQMHIDTLRSSIDPNLKSLLDVVTAEKNLEHVEKDLAALHRARTEWQAAQRANDVSDTGSSEAELWSALATACSSAIANVLASGLGDFRKTVQGFLPGTDEFHINLLDGEREVCQVGLVRDRVIHTALSGAEWARVTAALAAACSPKAGPAVIIPEERAFDPDTLERVCESFANIDGQVIIASPVGPTNLPAGWTLVRTRP